MNKHKSVWVIIGLVFVLIALFLLMKQGCDSIRNDGNAKINSSERIKKLLNDSANSAKEKEDYEKKNQLREGQLSLSNNRIAALTIGLDSANDRITALLKRYRPVTANTDTGITTVPNAFIADCSDCFTELGKGQQSVLKYKAEKDNQEYQYKNLIKTKDSRIKSLEVINTGITRSYKSLLDSAGKLNARAEIRRTLYFKLGALSINQTLPNAVGAGFVYQDKLKRLYGLGYYISSFGTIYSADISFPLSLKFK